MTNRDTSTSYTSLFFNTFVTGPVCDHTDGSLPHTSTPSCICGKKNACTSTNGSHTNVQYCYAPESQCQAMPKVAWVPTCNSSDYSNPNAHACVCGATTAAAQSLGFFSFCLWC
jgi:hypothetical protein